MSENEMTENFPKLIKDINLGSKKHSEHQAGQI